MSTIYGENDNHLIYCIERIDFLRFFSVFIVFYHFVTEYGFLGHAILTTTDMLIIQEPCEDLKFTILGFSLATLHEKKNDNKLTEYTVRKRQMFTEQCLYDIGVSTTQLCYLFKHLHKYYVLYEDVAVFILIFSKYCYELYG